MTKFYKLPNDIQNYIIKEFESHSETINDKGNIKVILNDDESRKLARAINIKFRTTFTSHDIFFFSLYYERMINV